MNVNSAKVQETLLNAIDAVIQQRNSELKLDKTITAIVKKNVGARNGRPLYQLQYDGGFIQAAANDENATYEPNTSVYVLVPQGNFSNEKFIIGRASSIMTNQKKNTVISEINKYSIMGSNLFQDISNSEYGLRSFHKIQHNNNECNEDSHWANVIYEYDLDQKFNSDFLNALKEDSTGLMIKADFKTNLDISQKNTSSAVYGLIFDFVFKNLNVGYGETNGEILKAIYKKVVANQVNIYTIDNNNNENYILQSNYTLEKIVTSFENTLKNYSGTFDNLINKESGIIARILDNIDMVYNVFKENNKKEDIEIIQETVKAYCNLLKELQDEETENLQNSVIIANIQTKYNNWKKEKVGDSAEKIEQFTLTSSNMIGNPFNFNQWNSQYSMFSTDLTNFIRLNRILFFKQGFIENSEAESKWPLGVEGGSEDIFVKNIQIYAIKPLEIQGGDYSLKVEPASDSTNIFAKGANNNSELKMEATILRKFIENLTYSSNTKIEWFKESATVINNSSVGYNALAGIGWEKLNVTGQQWIFKTKKSDNSSYKNNYKCIVTYDTDDDIVTLTVTFTIYNLDALWEVELISSLGDKFSYDVGSPTVTVRTKNKSNSNSSFTEYAAGDSKGDFHYKWGIQNDTTSGELVFLNDYDDETSPIMGYLKSYFKNNILGKIKKYNLSNETEINNFDHASHIVYPISSKTTDFTIVCQVLQKNTDNRYVLIGSATLPITIDQNGKDDQLGSFRIQIVNGEQVFQYDEYGISPTNEKNKNPLTILPLEAKLFNRSGAELQDTNYTVEWIFPTENSMIIPLDTLENNPRTNKLEMVKGKACNFNISNIFNPDFYNNQITCHINFGDNNNLYKDTNFYFGKQGSNGTNGTDVVAKIYCKKIDPNNLLKNQALALYINNQNKVMCNIPGSKPSSLSNTIDITGDNGILDLKTYQKQTTLTTNNIKWSLSSNPKYTTKKYYSTSNGVLKFNTTSNNDSTAVLYSVIKAETSINSQTYYAYYNLPIIKYHISDIPNLVNSKVIIDKKGYLDEIIYNADGRNPIYNHNQGLKLINIPSNVNKITFTAKGGFNKDSNNKYLETQPCFKLLKNKDNINGNTSITMFKNSDKSWRYGSINGDKVLKNEIRVYVLPNDIYAGDITNNRIEVILSNNDTKIVTVYAPIYMSLNTFGLASLNAWDGNSVTIDNDGGYVMAPQIGAGEKDSNNLFTGILMGKTEQYTGGSEKEKQVGLFGYKNGLQSIFLDAETGDATFGLPNVVEGKYKNTSRNAPADTYGEGRIELRPGGESKIGGWRIGRQSFYYTLKPKTGTQPIVRDNIVFYDYEYAGTLDNKYYNENHHNKDISWNHQGILLSADPPYISIKTKRLTVGSKNKTGNDYDINQDEENNCLQSGDSLELLLDPNKKSFFTIYRHRGNNNREPLVGIDGSGRFYTNSIRDRQTSLNMNWIDAFGKTANSQKYIGLNLNFKQGSKPEQSIFRAFIFNTNSANNLDMSDPEWQEQSTVLYLSGGNSQNEYLRPMRLYGESVYMFAYPSRARINDRYAASKTSTNPTGDPEIALKQTGSDIYFQLGYTRKTSTDENGNTRYDIEDNTAKGYINLANDTYLRLNQQKNNSFRTYGTLTQSIGGNLTLTTRGDYIERVTEEDENGNEITTLVQRPGNITINTKNIFTLTSGSEASSLILDENGYFSLSAVDKKYNITINKDGYSFSGPSDSDETNNSYMQQIKFYAGARKNKNNSYLELGEYNNISLGQKDAYMNIGESSSEIKTSTTGGRIHIVSKTVGEGAAYNTGESAQIRLQAGNSSTTTAETDHRSYFELNSSTNAWKHNKNGHFAYGDLETNHWFRIWTSKTLSGITGYIDVERINNQDTYKSVIQTYADIIELRANNNIQFVNTANEIKFSGTQFTGNGKDVQYYNHETNPFYYTPQESSVYAVTDLKTAIDMCLKAAGLAKRAADVAQSTANQAIDDAAAAQSTANQAIDDAATAKNRADEAYGHAESEADNALNSAKTYAYGLVYNGNAARWATFGHDHNGVYANVQHSHQGYICYTTSTPTGSSNAYVRAIYTGSGTGTPVSISVS